MKWTTFKKETHSHPEAPVGSNLAEHVGSNSGLRTNVVVSQGRERTLTVWTLGLVPALLLAASLVMAFHPAPRATSANNDSTPSPAAVSTANSAPATGAAASTSASSSEPKNNATAPASGAAMTMAAASTRLSALGYWSGPDSTAANGDTRLRLAVNAFQRVTGSKPTGVLSQSDLQSLSVAAAPTPRETGYAHVEADLTKQVLFVVGADGVVSKVLPISSGSGKLYTFQGKTDRASTPRGRFTVYNKISGWRKAPLGMIYYPCYFDKGVAIHGSQSVPNYPASHGCIRIPIPTAKELSEVVSIGTVVLVYDEDSSSAPAAR